MGVNGVGINSDWLSVDILWLDTFSAGKVGVDMIEVGKFVEDIFDVGKFGIDILAASKFGVDIFVEGKFGIGVLDEGILGLDLLVICKLLAGKFVISITGKLGVLILDVDRFVFVMFTGVELGDGILSLNMLIGKDFGVDNT